MREPHIDQSRAPLEHLVDQLSQQALPELDDGSNLLGLDFKFEGNEFLYEDVRRICLRFLNVVFRLISIRESDTRDKGLHLFLAD